MLIYRSSLQLVKFVMYIKFDVNNPIESFINNLKEYDNNFDVDEHVYDNSFKRGKNGVPSTYRGLVEDAEAIKNMIHELASAIAKLRISQF